MVKLGPASQTSCRQLLPPPPAPLELLEAPPPPLPLLAPPEPELVLEPEVLLDELPDELLVVWPPPVAPDPELAVAP